MTGKLDTGQSCVMRHLKVFEDAGLWSLSAHDSRLLPFSTRLFLTWWNAQLRREVYSQKARSEVMALLAPSLRGASFLLQDALRCGMSFWFKHQA